MFAHSLLSAVSALAAGALLSASGEQSTRHLRLRSCPIPLRHLIAHFTLRFNSGELIFIRYLFLYKYIVCIRVGRSIQVYCSRTRYGYVYIHP